MTEQQKKKKPRKQSHKEEEEEKITRKHKTKKRREQSSASIPKCLAKEKSLPQRFKVLSETNEEDKGFMQIALPKQNSVFLLENLLIVPEQLERDSLTRKNSVQM